MRTVIFRGPEKLSFTFRLVLLSILLLPLLGAAAPDASTGRETLRGYLVDLVCVKEEAGKLSELGPSHTRKCLQMPACVQGGYAILLPSNEVLAFDDHGNELARKRVGSGHQEKGWLVKVTGVRTANQLRVLRIE